MIKILWGVSTMVSAFGFDPKYRGSIPLPLANLNYLTPAYAGSNPASPAKKFASVMELVDVTDLFI